MFHFQQRHSNKPFNCTKDANKVGKYSSRVEFQFMISWVFEGGGRRVFDGSTRLNGLWWRFFGLRLSRVTCEHYWCAGRFHQVLSTNQEPTTINVSISLGVSQLTDKSIESYTSLVLSHRCTSPWLSPIEITNFYASLVLSHLFSRCCGLYRVNPNWAHDRCC
ncbi:hypothetical protein G7K_2797-t1 [Saitoella complicata NRRL Y-17804]|uniref:Uncharacterized protein n=1 Tax=Saitoella complicata (strain BCRC 22490 / CBS 7301 / JCM 7358 / NBRC 10748 / NRRL Y-17804) TaxID=698492 RepID=A0A0E9NFI7_SAICN|nr:hypothetical protein G7K_2797-t1 [Saitoella complicata NRRL Y-17804]